VAERFGNGGPGEKQLGFVSCRVLCYPSPDRSLIMSCLYWSLATETKLSDQRVADFVIASVLSSASNCSSPFAPST
jgi:hypothetical protein